MTDLVKEIKLTELENEMPDVSSLVNKTNYDKKISELENEISDYNHDKYITTLEFNTFASKVFRRSCLKQDKDTFNHGKVVNIYIVYEISKKMNISNYPALESCFVEQLV